MSCNAQSRADTYRAALNLARVNAAARRAIQTRFTALLHHVDQAALERAFRRQRRQASAGVDGMTVAAYAQDLEANLQDLCSRIHTGRYRPQPVRRVFIPKVRAGVFESDVWYETDRATPQGAGISPLLANVILHYILDLWVHQWRRRHARGRVVIVRYADDFVMGFEKEADAREMLSALKERLAGFGLALHEDKTRLIEFGRLPALAR